MDLFPEVARMLRQKGKKHLQEDAHFVIPCYRIQGEAFGSGFPLEMLPRIQCLLYRQFFYLPPSKRFKAGISRFDRLQVIIGSDPAAISPADLALSLMIYDLFMAMFLFCISGKEDEELLALRDILREAYVSDA